MHAFLLSTHSIVRWLVLILAIVAIVLNFKGWLSKGSFEKRNRGINAAYIGTLHLQLLIGFILYGGASPLMKQILADFKTAMKVAEWRFWAVEHITLMVFAVVFAQVAQILSKRSEDDAAKFKKAAIGFTISLVLILAAIPWPFRSVGRPLFPF